MAEGVLSEEDANILAVLPYLAGMAVAISGRSNILGFLREIRVVEHIPELADEFTEDGLIRAALANRDHYTITVTPQLVIVKEKDDDIKHRYTPDRLHDHVVELCERVCAILDTYGNESEAAHYKQWVMKAADAVANAATEGGLFGIGRAREAEHEQQMIDAIRTALGVQTGG